MRLYTEKVSFQSDSPVDSSAHIIPTIDSNESFLDALEQEFDMYTLFA